MMKIKLIFLLFPLFAGNVLTAQKKDIRLDIGFQRNLQENIFNQRLNNYDERGHGYGFHISPIWHYSKALTFGVSMEYNSVYGYYPTDYAASARAWRLKLPEPTYEIFSFTPTVTYYFTENKVKPFAGFGAGAYYFLYHTPVINFGIKPSIGITFNKTVNLSFEYSRIFGEVKPENPHDFSYLSHFGHNIISVKAGFTIGLMHTKYNR